MCLYIVFSMGSLCFVKMNFVARVNIVLYTFLFCFDGDDDNDVVGVYILCG